MTTAVFRLLAAAALWLVLVPAAFAATTNRDNDVRQLWQLLDYVSVDYGGAVNKGQVVSTSEYAEMREFSESALQQARALPDQPAKEALLGAVVHVRDAVLNRADGVEVARLAQHADALLLAAYPVPVAPKSIPNLQRGAALYQSQCASCHGSTGHADGPLAANLDPKPIAFSDPERARSRSLMALHQVISQGVAGTSMPSFANLPDNDRWALAFYAGTLSHDDASRQRGAALWKQDAAARAQWPNLAALTTLTEASAAESLESQKARDLTAYLRSHPEAIAVDNTSGIALARTRLRESLAALKTGNTREAIRLGLSAYLDGFEPLEPTLSARNPALLRDVESTMLQYRAAVSASQVEHAETLTQHLDQLFTQAQDELEAGLADPATTFVGSLTILLREGAEALLIVIGMLAFLRKTDRTEFVRYVHAGWVIALAAGAATWAVATYVASISGASRELTEGFSSLFAAVVLLGVGLWMHQKSSAGRWQSYLKDKLSSAMSRRSAWGLFALAFVAVYREVFESVLFYSALAVDGNTQALLMGLIVGAGLLAALAWALLRTSARMPIGKFFGASSVLVAVLAVILAGKGVAALQEAGWITANAIAWPHVQVLGMYPSAETAMAQLVVLVVALAGFALNSQHSGPRAAAGHHASVQD